MVRASPIELLFNKLGFSKDNIEDKAKKAIVAADKFVSASGVLLIE